MPKAASGWHRPAFQRATLAGPILLALAGCGSGEDARPVVVDIIGSTAELATPGRHDRSLAAQTALSATAQGLVAFDARGEIIAGLAESWIVVDEGQSYIFRLKRTRWDNGELVKAETVARLVAERMRLNRDLLGGLRPQVRAMTERVIEIRLETAVPSFLQLLANQRFAIRGQEGGTGPFVGQFKLGRLYLKPRPDVASAGADAEAAEIPPSAQRTLEAGRAALAVARYQDGRTDLVLGGRFEDLPIVATMRVGASDVRADPVPGLFGLAIVGHKAFLADRAVRDALSRAVDRTQMAKVLNLQGWTTTTTPLPAALDMSQGPTMPEWAGETIEQRVAAAHASIAAWAAAHGEPPILRVALPAGPGATMLFYRLAADYRRLDLRLDRVALADDADLRLIDSVAAFDSALWYLAQLDCESGTDCDPDASSDLDAARSASTRAEQRDNLAKAERLIVSHAGYIPLGLPIRWSLVSRRLNGFAPSPRAVHPLRELLRQPN